MSKRHHGPYGFAPNAAFCLLGHVRGAERRDDDGVKILGEERRGLPEKLRLQAFEPELEPSPRPSDVLPPLRIHLGHLPLHLVKLEAGRDDPRLCAFSDFKNPLLAVACKERPDAGVDGNRAVLGSRCFGRLAFDWYHDISPVVVL